MRLEARPVTKRTWPEFERLFRGRGCPHYCWCMPYRDRRSQDMSKQERKQAMKTRVAEGVPVGLLAFAEGEPVGWCSVAPRETYPKLDNSRTMPRQDDAPTWTILCMFVRRDHRGQGVPTFLARHAKTFAVRAGAEVVEAYPFDTMGITSLHRGHSSVYRAAGFQQEGRRWVWRRGKTKRRVSPFNDA